MAKLKALLLTEGYHGMISQVEGLAKALQAEFQHKIVRLNWPWNFIPPKLTPISEIILKDKHYKVFCDQAPNDSGLSLGAAKYYYYDILDNKVNKTKVITKQI